MLLQAAAGQDHGALIVSLEMRREELMDRLIAAEAEVPYDAVQFFGSETSDSDRKKILDAIAAIESKPIHVVDAFTATPIGSCGTGSQAHAETSVFASGRRLPAATATEPPIGQ